MYLYVFMAVHVCSPWDQIHGLYDHRNHRMQPSRNCLKRFWVREWNLWSLRSLRSLWSLWRPMCLKNLRRSGVFSGEWWDCQMPPANAVSLRMPWFFVIFDLQPTLRLWNPVEQLRLYIWDYMSRRQRPIPGLVWALSSSKISISFNQCELCVHM